MNYVAGFHSQWDSEFFSVIYHIVKTPHDKSRDMHRLGQVISKKFLDSTYSRVIYTENHDTIPQDRQCRIPTAISPEHPEDFFAQKRSILAAAILFTTPGIPMLLQGQELLEIICPTWPNPPTLTWDRRATLSHVFAIYQNLINLRKNSSGKTRGLISPNVKIYHTNPGAQVIVFYRFEKGGPGDDVIVVGNFSNRTWNHYIIGFPRPGKWKIRFNSDEKKYHNDFGGVGEDCAYVEAKAGLYDKFLWNGAVSIGKYSVLILSQDLEDSGLYIL